MTSVDTDTKMTSNGRGGLRPAGRSPPFLLIGLTVVLLIIGFNYWNVSSRNTYLVNQLGSLRDEIRTLTSLKVAAEVRSEDTLSKKTECERLSRDYNAAKDQCMEDLKGKNLAIDIAKSDSTQCFNDKSACEDDKMGINDHLHKVEEQLKAAEEKNIQSEKACDEVACQVPIGRIINILTNTIGKDSIQTALSQGGFDIKTLTTALEGGANVLERSNLSGEAQVVKNLPGTGQISEGAGNQAQNQAQNQQQQQPQWPGQQVQGVVQESQGTEHKQVTGQLVQGTGQGPPIGVQKPQDGGQQVQGPGQQVQEVGQQVQGTGQQVQGVGQQVQEVGQQVQGTGQQVQGVGQQVLGGGQGPQGAEPQLQGPGQQVQGTGQQLQGAGQQLQGTGQQVQGTGQQLQGAGQQLQGTGQQLQGAEPQLQGAGHQLRGKGQQALDALQQNPDGQILQGTGNDVGQQPGGVGQQPLGVGQDASDKLQPPQGTGQTEQPPQGTGNQPQEMGQQSLSQNNQFQQPINTEENTDRQQEYSNKALEGVDQKAIDNKIDTTVDRLDDIHDEDDPTKNKDQDLKLEKGTGKNEDLKFESKAFNKDSIDELKENIENDKTV